MKIRKAILIIHGFAGSTYDEEILAQDLELEWNFNVFTYTLKGHENNLFMNKKYQDWIDCSVSQVEYLKKNGYKVIYVIGHSMGGVIACYLASKYKEIKKVVLAAPAFKYIYNKDDKFITTIKKGKLLINDYGYEEVLKRALKSSISSAKEFMKLVRKYYYTPKKITVPVLIIQGLSDNLVPKDSSLYVYNSVKGKKVLLYLKDVNHDIFHSKKVYIINKKIKKFLKGNIQENIITM